MLTPYASAQPERADIDATVGPVVLEFGANWCGYCRAAEPLVEQALAQALESHPQLRHIRVEDGPRRALGRSYRIKLWPTLVMLRDGQEVARVVRPDEVDALKQALAQVLT